MELTLPTNHSHTKQWFHECGGFIYGLFHSVVYGLFLSFVCPSACLCLSVWFFVCLFVSVFVCLLVCVMAIVATHVDMRHKKQIQIRWPSPSLWTSGYLFKVENVMVATLFKNISQTVWNRLKPVFCSTKEELETIFCHFPEAWNQIKPRRVASRFQRLGDGKQIRHKNTTQ